jgi:ATP-binding cassette subfamily F protein uup
VIAPEGDGRWIEYAGGYSDMLAQRGGRTLEERAARRKDEPSPKAKSAPKPPASGPAKKLSYKQKYALETLPGEMDKAHGRIAALETKMADPAFYTRDPAGFAKAAADLDAQREKLAAMEEEWLELEMLREEIEG